MTINNQDEREALIAVQAAHELVSGAAHSWTCRCGFVGGPTAGEIVQHRTDAILAANFHRNVGAVSVEHVIDDQGECQTCAELQSHAPSPSVVTTVEELEALPEGTAIRDREGFLLEVQYEIHDYGDGEVQERWYNGPSESYGRDVVPLPATVLGPVTP